MSVKEFLNELGRNERVEGELLRTLFVSLIACAGALVLMYMFVFQNVENFIPKYGFYMFFVVLSTAIVMPSIIQVSAFKRFPCMTGMMIGMTIGMMSGFLFGFYVGATNGMFWGGVYGMVVGIILGVWKGKCCGVMGVMEGMMAGFMGGLMGAMTAVMMYNDNLKAAGVIMFIICGAILLALNYMLYQETKREEREYKEGDNLTIFISIALIVITTWFMVFGPKSLLFQ